MLFHVTDAPESPGTIAARVLCTTVFVGFRIWGVAVTESGILWKRLTGEVLGLLTPPGGVILILPQSLAGSWLCSQLGHSGGRQELAPKPQAETGDRPRAIGSWDCAKEIREELPQLLGVGRGFRAVGSEVYLRAGLPQLPEVRARQFGSPVVPVRELADFLRCLGSVLGAAWGPTT